MVPVPTLIRLLSCISSPSSISEGLRESGEMGNRGIVFLVMKVGKTESIEKYSGLGRLGAVHVRI